MARLPQIESRMDPGLGNAGFLSPSVAPVPSPLVGVPRGFEAAAQGLDAYGQAVDRVRQREETIKRAETHSGFVFSTNEQYRARLTAGGFRGKDDVLELRSWLDEQVDQTLGGWQGSESGRTALAERLLEARAALLDQAAGAAVTAQRAAIVEGIGNQARPLAMRAVTDPGSLPEVFGEIDRIIDDVADALAPEEEIEQRAIYRAQASAAAVEGMLMMGDHEGAMSVLMVPGVAEALPPAQQTQFAARLTHLRRDEDMRANERRQRLEDAAFALSTPGNPMSVDQLPTWARVQAMGMQMPQAPARPQAQSPIGKVIQDRALFVEQYGEDSQQVAAFDQMTQSEGEPRDLSSEAGIRKEFTGQSKDFVEIRSAYDKIQAAAENPGAAGDLALIFGYMKILDPGSVVRESEFANAQNAAGVPDRIKNLWNNLKSGERLNPAQREDFLGQAQALVRTQAAAHVALEEEFRRLARDARINPDSVVVDYMGELRRMVRPGAAPGSAAAGGAPGNAPGDVPPPSPSGPVIEYGMDGLPLGGGAP